MKDGQPSKTAQFVAAIAQESEDGGHAVSAREAYLRASNYYRTAYPFLYGAPTHERLVEAFERETDAFRSAAALFDPPVESVEIPYEGTTLPGYFYRVDNSDEPRPTVIATNGYDSTIQEMHFAHAVAAVNRGYNCLTFDGPGQGGPLIEEGLTMRPDWEHVVTPVVDYAVSRSEVDSDALKPLFDAVEPSPELTWTLEQRNLWVHGMDSIMDYIRALPEYISRMFSTCIARPSGTC